MKKIAAKGILTCLQDVIDSLNKGETAFTSKKDYGKEETVGSCLKDTPRTLDTSNIKYLQRKDTGLSEIA
ncbi:hypothetical protein Tco_0298687 [Tanacetum coccineum]